MGIFEGVGDEMTWQEVVQLLVLFAGCCLIYELWDRGMK